MDATVIILAAGEGTRMKSNHAKVSHRILAKPMIRWIVDASLAAGAQRVVTVVGSHGDEVRALLEGIDGVECVEQAERLGTGHAVKVAIEACGISEGPVVVLNGDLPLIEPRTIRKFADTVAEGRAAAAVLTMTPPDPFGYGRIELNDEGQVLRIIEQKDCTDEQAKTLLECNAGCYAFDGAALAAHVGEIGCDNAQHEYYLPDMLEILRRAGKPVTYFHCNDFRGGPRRQQPRAARRAHRPRPRPHQRASHGRGRYHDRPVEHLGRPPDAQVGRDTIIYPSTMIMGTTQIGEECIVGPNTRLMDTRVGSHSVIDETVAENVQIDDYVSCGPRAYLRPGTHLCDHSKAGTHVEIKKSTIGVGSKVPHLSYIGDTTMGANVNIGAGSITCNYDGVHKNATTIGDNTFIGSDTMMVAPVNIGADAVTGAGGTITKDVPDGALALERTEQRIIPGYTERKRARQQGK